MEIILFHVGNYTAESIDFQYNTGRVGQTARAQASVRKGGGVKPDWVNQIS